MCDVHTETPVMRTPHGPHRRHDDVAEGPSEGNPGRALRTTSGVVNAMASTPGLASHAALFTAVRHHTFSRLRHISRRHRAVRERGCTHHGEVAVLAPSGISDGIVAHALRDERRSECADTTGPHIAAGHHRVAHASAGHGVSRRVSGDRGAVSLEQVLWFVASGVSVAVVAGILWSRIREQANSPIQAPTSP